MTSTKPHGLHIFIVLKNARVLQICPLTHNGMGIFLV